MGLEKESQIGREKAKFKRCLVQHLDDVKLIGEVKLKEEPQFRQTKQPSIVWIAFKSPAVILKLVSTCVP